MNSADTGVTSDIRSQSEVIGVVLIIALTVTSTTAIVALGNSAITDTQESAELQNVENSMTQLDSQASLVAHGETGSKTVSISGGSTGGIEVDDSAGEMTIKVKDDAGNHIGPSPTTITLGKATYEKGETTVAYQGGGVWRQRGSGEAVMVSPPEFDFTVQGSGPPTLTLPLVQIDGDANGRRVTVSKAAPTTKLFPVSSSPNPLRDGSIEITVKSQYYRAWGRFFETRTTGSVTYDDPNNKVTVDLVIPRSLSTSGAVGSGAGTLTLANNGDIDSYDSDDAPYSNPIHPNANAPVTTEGNIVTSNNFHVDGSVTAEGYADIDNAIEVSGPFVVGDYIDIDNSPVYGDTVSAGTYIEINNGPQFNGDLIAGTDLTIESGASSADFNGNLYAGGDIIINDNVDIDGDIIAAGDVTINQISTLNGDIIAGGDVTINDDVSANIDSGGLVDVNSDVTGDVITDGEIEIDSSAQIDGNAKSGRDAGSGDAIRGSGTITGDAVAADKVEDSLTVNGNTKEEQESPAPSASLSAPKAPLSASVDLPEDVDSEINNKGSTFSSNNDNGDVAAISSNSLTGCGSTCTLPAGEYYLSDINLGSGDTLELDTSGGRVQIYVDGDADFDDAEIEITGSDKTVFYLNEDLLFEQSQVVNPDDNAEQLWFLMHSDEDADISKSSTEFRGVLYGPPASSNDGVAVTISNNPTIYGAVVGDVTTTGGVTQFHYDESLATASVLTGSTTASVTYLHISYTTVEIKDT